MGSMLKVAGAPPPQKPTVSRQVLWAGIVLLPPSRGRQRFLASATSSAHCEPTQPAEREPQPAATPPPQPPAPIAPPVPGPPAPAALQAPRGPGAPGGGGRKCESDRWRSSTWTLYRHAGEVALDPGSQHGDDAWARTLMLGSVVSFVCLFSWKESRKSNRVWRKYLHVLRTVIKKTVFVFSTHLMIWIFKNPIIVIISKYVELYIQWYMSKHISIKGK